MMRKKIVDDLQAAYTVGDLIALVRASLKKSPIGHWVTFEHNHDWEKDFKTLDDVNVKCMEEEKEYGTPIVQKKIEANMAADSGKCKHHPNAKDHTTAECRKELKLRKAKAGASSKSAGDKKCIHHPNATSHTTEECRTKGKATDEAKRGPQEGGAPAAAGPDPKLGEMKCFHCHELGHLRTRCPKLKQQHEAHFVTWPEPFIYVDDPPPLIDPQDSYDDLENEDDEVPALIGPDSDDDDDEDEDEDEDDDMSILSGLDSDYDDDEDDDIPPLEEVPKKKNEDDDDTMNKGDYIEPYSNYHDTYDIDTTSEDDDNMMSED